MKTAIIFSSSHGTTEKAANLLKEQIRGEVALYDLKQCPSVNLTEYSCIILGSSIYAGSAQAKVKHFLKNNYQVLKSKRIGLFICCMFEGDTALQQFATAYPQELRDKSLANGNFGGEFIFAKLNFLERLMVKKVAGATGDVSKLDLEQIKEFAAKINAIN